MKEWTKIFRQALLLTQLGLSLLTPTLMCVAVCCLIQHKYGVGAWIYIPGFILGLGSSGMTFWKFYCTIVGREERKKKEEKHSVSFNRHD